MQANSLKTYFSARKSEKAVAICKTAWMYKNEEADAPFVRLHPKVMMKLNLKSDEKVILRNRKSKSWTVVPARGLGTRYKDAHPTTMVMRYGLRAKLGITSVKSNDLVLKKAHFAARLFHDFRELSALGQAISVVAIIGALWPVGNVLFGS